MAESDLESLRVENENLRVENDLLLRHIRALHEASKLGPILSDEIIAEVTSRG